MLYIDGERIDRQLGDFMDAMRPPGAWDLKVRLKDLDQEGVWSQLAFPSMGFWLVSITDRELARETVRAWNDWAYDEILSKNKRVITTACVSTADIDDAVAEVERAAEMGFQAVFLPCSTRAGEEYALDRWEPLWTAAERAGVVLAFHIGTGGENVVFRGPGGAVVNYMETTYPGMRVVSHMVAGGALDRHPDLKILIAEGGAGWVPAIGDRMDEAYRQHGMFVRPKLKPAAQRDHPPAGVRVLPARQELGGDRRVDRLPQCDVGRRLPPPGRHVRPHPVHAARPVRRRARGHPRARHARHLQRTVRAARTDSPGGGRLSGGGTP